MTIEYIEIISLQGPWVTYDETSVSGYPTPPTEQAATNTFGQVSNGTSYSFAVAYVSSDGVIGPKTVFISGYVPPTKMTIPGHYLLGGEDYVPTVSLGIPYPSTGYPDNTTGLAIAGIIQEADQNQITCSYELNFQITNQPTDGRLREVAIFTTKTPAGGPATTAQQIASAERAFQFYTYQPAVAVGNTPNTLPVIGNYQFYLMDLSNPGANGTIDFYVACGAVDGSWTDPVYLGTSAPVAPLNQTAPNGTANLLPDTEFTASTYCGGVGGTGHGWANDQISTANPYWTFFGLDGDHRVIVKSPGGPNGCAGVGTDYNGGGTRFGCISVPVTGLKPSYAYSFAMSTYQGNGSPAYCALIAPTTNPDPSTWTIYAQAAQSGIRASNTWTCPADGSVTEVCFAFDSGGEGVPKGDYFIAGQFQLQFGGLSGYIPGLIPPATVAGGIFVTTSTTTATTASASTTITSSTSTPTSGPFAPVADQQPLGSIRLTQAGVQYQQTSSDPTNPNWVPVVLNSDLLLAELNDIDQSTAGDGKVLTAETSNGKAYSWQTPSGGSGGSGALSQLTDVHIGPLGITPIQYIQNQGQSTSSLVMAFGSIPKDTSTLVMMISWAAFEDVGFSPPSGWTQYATTNNGNQGLTLIYKASAGITDQSITINQRRTDGFAAVCFEFPGTCVLSQSNTTGAFASIPANSAAIVGFSANNTDGGSPGTGWIRYAGSISPHNNATDIYLGPAGAETASNPWGDITLGGNITLGALVTDTSGANLADGQVLTYSAALSAWTNVATGSGGGSGTGGQGGPISGTTGTFSSGASFEGGIASIDTDGINAYYKSSAELYLQAFNGASSNYLQLDASNNVTLGNSGSYLTGSSVYGATGSSIAGPVSATGYSGGPISGTTGSFSGEVNVGSLSSTGTVSGSSLSSSGGVAVGGPLTGATTGSFSGEVNVGSLSSTGTVSGSGYSGGPVSATTGEFSGDITGASYSGGPVSGTTGSFSSGLLVSSPGNVNTQGAWIGWNGSGGDGETDFDNQKGVGVGGWVWRDVTTSNVATTVATLNTSGGFSTTGDINVAGSASLAGGIALIATDGTDACYISSASLYLQAFNGASSNYLQLDASNNVTLGNSGSYLTG
ncbi:MAG: hypothetical protein WAN50_02445, partial [Minisyncoccia bacterium]